MASNLGFLPSAAKPFYFISYCNKDASRVSSIAVELNKMGVPLWYDRGLPYGEEWEKDLCKKIAASEGVVFFFTRTMLEKEDSYAIKEFTIAKNQGKHIIPFCIDPLDVPSLSRSFPVHAAFLFELSRIHAPQNFNDLVRALPLRRAPKKDAPTPPEKAKPIEDKKPRNPAEVDVVNQDRSMWMNFNNATYPDEKKARDIEIQIFNLKKVPIERQRQLGLHYSYADLANMAKKLPAPKPGSKEEKKPAPKPEAPKGEKKPAPKPEAPKPLPDKPSAKAKDENISLEVELRNGDGRFEKGWISKTSMLSFVLSIEIDNPKELKLLDIRAQIFNNDCFEKEVRFPNRESSLGRIEIEVNDDPAHVKAVISVQYRIGFLKTKDLEVTVTKTFA